LIRFLREREEDGTERFYKIDFFRLIRLLERARPDLPRVGLSRLPAQDLVRFAQKPYQNFASSALQDLEINDGQPPRVSVAFFGMFGPCGALPLCYTEYALQRLGSNRSETRAAETSNGARLKVSDFYDLQRWVRRLRRHEDPMTRLLWEQLPLSMRQRIQDITPASFQVAPLRDEFIRVMGEGLALIDLWPAAVEMKISPPAEVEELVQKRSSKSDFFRLNRYLLGLAFKEEIAFVRRVASTPWDFESWHFADFAGFVRQCREGADVFSRVLRESFPARVRRLLADFSPGQFVVEPLLSDFLGALNELIATSDLIGAGACSEMSLPQEIRDLAASQPRGAVLAQLNRALLTRGFNGKISGRAGEAQRDQTLVRFLDIFHHRMTSHFYRAWAINQKSADLDRPHNDKTGERQKFPFYFSCLTGAGMDSLPNEDGIPALSRIYYSGHLMPQGRSLGGLQSILEDYFGIRTRIQPFMGRWLWLPALNKCALGRSASTGTMGQSVIVGSRLWDCKLSFRVQMGPMGLTDFLRMLPKRRIVCIRCRRPLEPENRQQDLLDKLPENVTRALSSEGGCPHCHYTGPADWDAEMQMSPGAGGAGARKIVCKKCRAPFGPDPLQRELQNLPAEQVSARLAKSAGCVSCQASRGRDWRVTEVGSFHRLKCWVKNYLGDEYFWDLQLILRKEEAPAPQLGRSGRLGQTLWSKTGPPKNDLDDVIISPEAALQGEPA
jgi:predicted component of type VI protein secretion system